MSESKTSEKSENKAHRAAMLVFKAWPGWKRLKDDLDYAAYFICPEQKTCVVFAYSPWVMRPSQWNRLCKPIKYAKIEGLFEAFPPFQQMKTAGVLTEFGKPPSLRGPRKQYKKRPSCVKSKKKDEELSEVEGSDFQSSESEDPMRVASDVEDPMDGLSDGEDPVVKVKPEIGDHFYDINYRNMIKVALRYREHHGIKSTELADVLAQMCQNGWAFCLQIHKQGILDTYFTEFTAQCEGKSSYTKEMISLMRRPVRKRARLALAAEADEAVGEASPLEQAETSDAASPSGLEALEASTAASAA